MSVLYPILCLRGHITIFLGAVVFHEGRIGWLFWAGERVEGTDSVGWS